MPTLHILAGPNGAGKSTLYQAALKPEHPNVEFVNADRLASAHFGHHAATEAEAKKGQELAEERRAALMAARKSLITESTFSHPSKLELIQEAKDLGYKIAVYHVNVSSADVSIDRVQNRVNQGGHDVPEDRIRGRYERNQPLIREAVLTANRGQVFDNSITNKPPELALKFERGQLTYVSERVPTWARDLYADQLDKFSAARLNPAAASFDQAKAITLKVLGDEAKTYIGREGGHYRGEIIGQTDLHTLQKLNDKSVVAHFNDKLQTEPTLSSYATIEYVKGQSKATVSERLTRAVAFEKQSEDEALKRFPELKPAYDIMRSFEARGRQEGTITDANVEQFRATLKGKMQTALDAGNLPKALNKETTLPERNAPDRER
jgi:predicted ABC-type ATPase